MPEPRIVESQHADGWPHARATVRRMAGLAREAAQSYEIRSLATAIVDGVPSKQTTAELAALYRWVRDSIRYRFDPVGVEWLQSPSRTLAEGSGDCDDIATLLAALAESLGHPTRYHVVGPDADTPKHVAVEAWDGSQWVTLDPVLEPPAQSTEPRQDFGQFGQRAEGHIVHFDGSGSQLGSYEHDLELWRWMPLAYSDTGLLVPVHSAYAGVHYNYPDAAMPDAIRPAGMLGALSMRDDPCIIIPRGLMGNAGCTCPVSDTKLGLGYWVNTGVGFDPWGWTKENIIDPIGETASDGWEWAKGAVSDGVSWLKKTYRDALDEMKPIADVALVISSIPGVSQVLGSIIPGGQMIVRSVQTWSMTVQKLHEDDGIPLDIAGDMAFDGLPDDMKKALDDAPEAMETLQNLDLSDLEKAGLDPDVVETIEQVRGNIPPDIDFSDVVKEHKERTKGRNGAPKATAAPSTTTRQPGRARAPEPEPEPPQTLPVPSDSGGLVELTSAVLDAVERDPQQAAELLQAELDRAVQSGMPRQRYDAGSGIYRIYAPVLSGLGASPPRSEDIRELAFNAGLRVAEIIDQTGNPPSVPVPEVRQFQAAVDTPADGLWGPNTRLAASYYLTVPLEQMPEVHRAFADTPATWEPPQSVPTLPEPEPEPDDPEVVDVPGPRRVQTRTTTPEPPPPKATAAPPPARTQPSPPEPEPEPEPDDRAVVDVPGPTVIEFEEPHVVEASPPAVEPPSEPEGGYREVGTSPVDPGLPPLDNGDVVSSGKPSKGSGVWPLLLAWIGYEYVY